MTDDNTHEQPGQTPPPSQPNWGNAYPPPGQASTPPPGYQPPPPGYQQPYMNYAAPKHPSATMALILGILGITICSFTAPFAWWIGSKAVKEIDASQGQQGGRSEALAGKIMGIIGTVLLGLAVVVIVFVIVLAIANPDAFEESGNYFIRGALG